MDIILNVDCDFNEFYDDTESKFLLDELFGIKYSGKSHVFMSKVAKISANIHSKYNTGGANKIIANPILKDFFKTLDAYFDGPIENLSCRYLIEYDKKIKFNSVYVIYEKNELIVSGKINLINYNPFKLDDILDKISSNGITSLSESELYYLNKISKQK